MRFLALAVLAGSTPAFADCPTNVRELPATGTFSSESPPDPTIGPLPELEIDLAAAGAVRGDSAVVSPTGAASGQLVARRSGLTGCASADVIDLTEGAARLTAAAQVPHWDSAMSLGMTIDRDIRLPLSSRREFVRAPLDRLAAQVSLSGLDEETVKDDVRMRVLIGQMTYEKGTITQSKRQRDATRAEVTVWETIVSGRDRGADLAVFRLESETIESGGLIKTGKTKMSPLSLALRLDAWEIGIDGGVLFLLDTAADCTTQTCTRGFYDVLLRRKIGKHSIDAGIERVAYLGIDDAMAFEDRATATYAFGDDTRTITTSAFAARSRAWLTKGHVHSIGTRVGYTQQLGHHMSALVDGELVRSEDDDLAARGVVSLAYQRKLLRY